MNKGKVGIRLRACRIAEKITTEEMAEYLGVLPQRVNSIERTLSHDHTIIRYLQYLRDKGVDLNHIFS